MATDFTNKYMQVFQDYNEFSEHSADYVRGEDHIAFLIEENEVIYWLYLEQVWRPLNVRTTTTGQLEDGRTKVAVRLEYIEGGQKYTSVPNIPDPERITSISHFLEDYPDIEEVNISGTVNLTDLSYAFAGSKIKDFSMLDTSNVTNIQAILMNVDCENQNYEITTNAETLYIDTFIINAKFDTIIINALNAYKINGNIANSSFTYIKKLICNYNIDKYNYILSGSYHLELSYIPNLEYIKFPNLVIDIDNTIENKTLDIETNKLYIKTNGSNASSILNINSQNIDVAYYNEGHKIKSKWLLQNETNILLMSSYKNTVVGFAFGYGIKGNYIFNTQFINNVGDFWFTVPIVDDNFYADKQCAVSIFQYKTTFEEVADVNISNEVDSSLIYASWNSIDFDTSNMNIEINNKVDIYSAQRTFNKTFNKFIINSGDIVLDSNYKNKLPLISALFEPQGNEVSISGTYLIYNGGNNSGHELYNKINNATLVYDSFFHFSLSQNNLVKENNIKFVRYNSNNDYGLIYLTGYDNINIDNYVVDNVLYCTFQSTPSSSSSRLIYNENYNIVIKDYCYLNVYEYYLQHENKVSLDSINDTVEFIHTNNLETDTIYLNCINGYLQLGISQDNRMNINTNVENINGNINLELPLYYSSYEVSTNINLLHIDINSVRINADTERQILIFNSCDKETTINLITMLKDNTGSTTNTIYMYRSQANIIGEENIAGAVAKNYEFAIIEN